MHFVDGYRGHSGHYHNCYSMELLPTQRFDALRQPGKDFYCLSGFCYLPLYESRIKSGSSLRIYTNCIIRLYLMAVLQSIGFLFFIFKLVHLLPINGRDCFRIQPHSECCLLPSPFTELKWSSMAVELCIICFVLATFPGLWLHLSTPQRHLRP